jgi:hypothetical protein
MGLLSNVLLLPLAPVRGVLWVAQLLEELASNELNDPELLRSRLREAEDAHRRGEISDEELDRIEDAVFTQLVTMQGARGGAA